MARCTGSSRQSSGRIRARNHERPEVTIEATGRFHIEMDQEMAVEGTAGFLNLYNRLESILREE